jgi:hypothetical protein
MGYAWHRGNSFGDNHHKEDKQIKKMAEQQSALQAGLPGVGDIAQAGTAIAQTVSNIIDQTKRRQFEMALANLSNRQQEELNNKLLQARSDTEKMQILSNSVLQYAIANQQSETSKETVMYVIAGGLAIVLLGAAIVLAKSK